MLSLFSTLPALDRVFDDVMRDSMGAFTSVGAFSPSVDVRTEDNRVVFQLDVPGVKPDDLSVEIEGNVLRVRGERKLAGYGAFERSWSLPDGMDTENLKASLEHGVLTVEIPKHPKAMPRKIQILNGGSSEKQLGEGSDK